ncbi:MAG: DUF512 domain-containing protein [Clostridiaceae bacterium]|nr:DUF512 domain-containing protein [Clostridiaceae bacterium]
MTEQTGHLISQVAAGSIAEELGLVPGDRLLALDGRPVVDVFDYRLRQLTCKLLLTIDKTGGGLFEFDIEKDQDEDIGLDFSDPIMSEYAGCANHCVFCFIDQLPPGLRSSLYFKDDDMRLSFLTGNYVTLTNIDDAEFERLISYGLSPVNLSVHTTDPALRIRMMRNPRAGEIMTRMRRLAAVGLAMNIQIVLCPDLNDGPALDRTLDDLIGLGPAVQSIAIVPVGLTRYRKVNGLFALRGLEREDAETLLKQIASRQQDMLEKRGIRLIYAADEIYLKAGYSLPDVAHYEDFPQLENGVGMASLLLQELAAGLEADPITAKPPTMIVWPEDSDDGRPIRTVLLVTGKAAEPLLEPWIKRLSDRFDLDVQLVPVVNYFLGESITVAGLLTGRDIQEQLRLFLQHWPVEKTTRSGVLLPGCLLKSGEQVLLDDVTVKDLSQGLGLPVLVCSADAAGLLGSLGWSAERRDLR